MHLYKKDRKVDLSENRQAKKGMVEKRYLILGILSMIFLFICIFTVTLFYRHSIQDQFDTMMQESLESYGRNQREKILFNLENTAETLESMAVWIGQFNDKNFNAAYLMAMNNREPDVHFEYLDKEYVETYSNVISEFYEKEAFLEKMKSGKTVISPIVYSKRRKGIYCFAISVPVFGNGEFLGMFQCIYNVEKLVPETENHSVLGNTINGFLIDKNKDLLPKEERNENLTSYLEEMQIHSETVQCLEDFLSDPDQYQNLCVVKNKNSSIYLIALDLGYNDWYYVEFFEEEMAAHYSRELFRVSVWGTVGIIAALLLLAGVVTGSILKLQKRIKINEKRYRLLEKFSNTVLFDYDVKEKTIHFTPNAIKAFRIHDLQQMNFLEHLEESFIYEEDRNLAAELFRGSLKEQKEMRVRLLRPDEDRYFWCQIQFQYLYEKERLYLVIGKITDIDEQKQREELLMEKSERDGLTGLKNHASTILRIEEQMKTGSGGMFFMIDIDDFKKVNDTYGHGVGDQTICFLGECLKKTFRAADIAGRIGGDEFVVYAVNLDSYAVCRQKADLLLEKIQKAPEMGLPLISVSIGISCCPDDADSYQGLYHAADQAMYRAKQAGKNGYSFFRAKP